MDGVAVLNDERAFCDAAAPIGSRGPALPGCAPDPGRRLLTSPLHSSHPMPSVAGVRRFVVPTQLMHSRIEAAVSTGSTEYK